MILFVSMIALIILTSCYGVANAYSFAIKKNMKNIQIMRAIGISRKQLIYFYIKEMIVWPLFAVVTSVIPIWIFDMLRKYAYHYAFDLNHNSYTSAANGKKVICLQALFPWYIELWKQPIVQIMFIAFLFIGGVNICTGIVSVNRVKKSSIVEGIRNESF